RVLAVVTGEPDHSHGRVTSTERAEHVGRLVAASVVHEDDLVRAADPLERPEQPLVQHAEAPRLVEHGDHDGERGRRRVAHRSISRTRRQSLWPPKPNEFETAARIRAARAVFGTYERSHSGSGTR